MQFDPIHLNFYHGTGGYVWQLAEFMQRTKESGGAEMRLERPQLPRLVTPFASYPLELTPATILRWAQDVTIMHDTPGLVGPRGLFCSLIISKTNCAFAGVDRDAADKLSAGVALSELAEINLHGSAYSAKILAVSLLRHGLVEADIIPESRGDGFIVEPTCVVRRTTTHGPVAINQLNGRTLRLGDEAMLFTATEKPSRLDAGSKDRLSKIFEAGILRRV